MRVLFISLCKYKSDQKATLLSDMTIISIFQLWKPLSDAWKTLCSGFSLTTFFKTYATGPNKEIILFSQIFFSWEKNEAKKNEQFCKLKYLNDKFNQTTNFVNWLFCITTNWSFWKLFRFFFVSLSIARGNFEGTR